MKTRSHTKPPHLAPEKGGPHISGARFRLRFVRPHGGSGLAPRPNARRALAPARAIPRADPRGPHPGRRGARLLSRHAARTERPPPPQNPRGPRLRRGDTKGRTRSGAPPGSRCGEAPARRKLTGRRRREPAALPPALTAWQAPRSNKGGKEQNNS